MSLIYNFQDLFHQLFLFRSFHAVNFLVDDDLFGGCQRYAVDQGTVVIDVKGERLAPQSGDGAILGKQRTHGPSIRIFPQ